MRVQTLRGSQLVSFRTFRLPALPFRTWPLPGAAGYGVSGGHPWDYPYAISDTRESF